MIQAYKGQKLKTIDRRLIRGLFLIKLNDFDEDYKDSIANRSLLSRLTDIMSVREQMSLRVTEHENGESSPKTNFNNVS